MDREQVIALAKNAGLPTAWISETGVLTWADLERFANLIEDHLTWSDLHTCNPGCTKPACVSMRRAEAHAAAVEREACAQVAEAFGKTLEVDVGDCFAEAIRSRT